jgi:enamine deaminase RidA (YjgF/YER057c/UK114 family)
MAIGISTAHGATVVKHVQTEKSALAVGVWVGDVYYLSGMVCCDVKASDIGAEKAGAKDAAITYGDMATQAGRVFKKIQSALREQGLDMKDVVKLTVMLATDKTTGKLDFAGMQSAYLQYFGTAEQPNKPARSAFQAAALAVPWALVEIEAIAVRSQ